MTLATRNPAPMPSQLRDETFPAGNRALPDPRGRVFGAALTALTAKARPLLLRPMTATFCAAMLLLGVAACSTPPRETAAPPAAKPDKGFVFGIMESTQGNFGDLSIGVGYTGRGTYLDENGARRDGLYASLSITVAGEPSLFQQPDVHEGQILTVGRYRIVILKIEPDSKPRGGVVLQMFGL